MRFGKYNRKKVIMIVFILVVVLVIGVFLILKQVNKSKQAESVGTRMEDLDTNVTGNNDSVFMTFNNEKIVFSNKDYAQWNNLNEDIEKKVDYDEILTAIGNLIQGETEGFLLSDINELQISKFNMPLVSIKDSSIKIISYKYLFERDKCVGYLMFYYTDNGKIDYTIFLNTKETRGYYLDYLENHKEKSFIVFTDGLKGYFLSSDNVMYGALSGEKSDKVYIQGDIYGELSLNELDVSYNKIVEEMKR